MTAELRERAQELREEGLEYRQIARKLGVPHSTLYCWLHPEYAERQRKLSREAKRRRTGKCVDCGKTTRYNGHPGATVSERCDPCSKIQTGLKKRGTGVRQRQMFAVLAQEGPMRYMEIRDALGLENRAMGPLIWPAMRNGLIVRVKRGVYRLP